MKISLRLFGYAVGFAALAVTGALAQSPESPAAFSFQFVSQFDYPGTGNQTRPQKINDLGDIAGLFVNTAAASFGFMRLNNGNFSRPIADPNATSNFTEGRGINNSRTVCGDYTDSAGAFEGFFLSGHTFTNYDPEIGGKWLGLLKEAIPSLLSATIIFNPETAPYAHHYLTFIQAAAPVIAQNAPGRADRGTGRAEPIDREDDVRPRKLGHVVLGSTDLEASERFFPDGVGFKGSDSIARAA